MSVKTEVLTLLEGNRHKDLSGQDIAELLGVTRAAVWKAVKSLQKEGYIIEAVNNRGYRLLENSDVLSAEGICLELKEEYQGCDVVVYKCIDSTNMEAKRRALDGAKEGLIVLAEEQTAGRGRRGRSFLSPTGTGIYMSFLFRPTPEQSSDVVLVTTAASVAVCRAIRNVLHEEPAIKWVNDIYLKEKKVCGILTEAVSDFESGRIDTVVVGIGINYREPQGGFPEEVKDIAGALCTKDDAVPRNCLAAGIINELFTLYENLSDKTYMADYKKWSNVLGKRVRFSSENNWDYGMAENIDDDGGLIIRKEDGTEQVLRTGEITLRVCD